MRADVWIATRRSPSARPTLDARARDRGNDLQPEQAPAGSAFRRAAAARRGVGDGPRRNASDYRRGPHRPRRLGIVRRTSWRLLDEHGSDVSGRRPAPRDRRLSLQSGVSKGDDDMTMVLQPHPSVPQISKVDADFYTIATLGSHSALQILKGARDEGFRTLVIVNPDTERLYVVRLRRRSDHDREVLRVHGARAGAREAQDHHRPARLVRGVPLARRAQEDADPVLREQSGARLGSEPRAAAPVAHPRRPQGAAAVPDRSRDRPAGHREAVRRAGRTRAICSSATRRISKSAPACSRSRTTFCKNTSSASRSTSTTSTRR